ADLGGDAGADAGRDHERADRWAEVAHQELEEDGADEVEVPDDLLRLDARLEDHDHAEEPHGRGHEEERADADLVHLAEDFALLPALAALEGEEERPGPDPAERAHLPDALEQAAPDGAG